MSYPLLPALIAFSLAACSPPPAPAGSPAPAVLTSSAPVADAEATPPPVSATEPAEPVQAVPGASIAGAIREGNRPPPALRICAHPADGGKPTCIDTTAGATSYRIEVAAGRYVVAGQALGDPGLKFAHAERIRCIRAPCPPDTALLVAVAAGEAKDGIDLTPGEALPPG